MQLRTVPAWLRLCAIFVFVTALEPPAAAQNCTPAGISLSSQAEVSTFQADHGPCDRVTGTLTVSGADISDLTPLAGLAQIDGSLEVFSNSSLGTLSGLASISSVGGTLGIQANPILSDSSGLSGLTSVGNALIVRDNDSLSSLTGLSSLSSVGGLVIVQDNAGLLDMSALTGLVSLPSSVTIENNSALASLSGLDNLVTVGGFLRVASNPALVDCSAVIDLVDVDDDPPPGPDVGGSVTVFGNGCGCAAVAEIVNGVGSGTLSVADVSRLEGDAGLTAFDFVVSLSAAVGCDVMAEASTVALSALSGSDFIAFSAVPVLVPAGDTQTVVTVDVIGDLEFEPDEEFALTLTNPSGPATPADIEAIATIQNDDVNLGAPIPTAGGLGLLLLALLLGGAAVLSLRRRDGFGSA